MRNIKNIDIKDILIFYKPLKRRIFLIILFILLLLISLLIDLQLHPYPPKLAFIDANNKSVKGDIYLDDEFIGTTIQEFGNLPDYYCKRSYYKRNHTLIFETKQESYSWQIHPSHCQYNLIKFEVG